MFFQSLQSKWTSIRQQKTILEHIMSIQIWWNRNMQSNQNKWPLDKEQKQVNTNMSIHWFWQCMHAVSMTAYHASWLSNTTSAMRCTNYTEQYKYIYLRFVCISIYTSHIGSGGDAIVMWSNAVQWSATYALWKHGSIHGELVFKYNLSHVMQIICRTMSKYLHVPVHPVNICMYIYTYISFEKPLYHHRT